MGLSALHRPQDQDTIVYFCQVSARRPRSGKARAFTEQR
jgi:hypothetical protein